MRVLLFLMMFFEVFFMKLKLFFNFIRFVDCNNNNVCDLFVLLFGIVIVVLFLNLVSVFILFE